MSRIGKWNPTFLSTWKTKQKNWEVTNWEATTSYSLRNYMARLGIWKDSIQTNLFIKIILIAATKLKVRATAGPHMRCCWRFAPSDERNTLKKLARKSSRALPELMGKNENWVIWIISKEFKVPLSMMQQTFITYMSCTNG